MTQLSDHQLLDRFRSDHDRAALDALVRRYIDMVYSAALRQVHDSHLAEDITQAVFIVLVRNARSIRGDAALAAWLFSVTRHASSNAIRVRNRQRHHEMQKILQTPEPAISSDDSISDELRANLDDAIASLPTVERSSVLLHFFSNRTHREIGESLGMSEEAARKRITRGLEKMRAMLAGRGVNMTSESILAGAMFAQAAPAGLIGSTVNIALLAQSIGGKTAAVTIAEGVTRMIAISKIKVAAAVIAALLLTGGVASPIVSHILRGGVVSRRPAALSTVIERAAPATQPAEKSAFTANVSDDTRVEFLGVSTFPPAPDSWWTIDGQPTEQPEMPLEHAHIVTQPQPEFVVVAKVTKPESTMLRMNVVGASMSAVIQSNDDSGSYIGIAFSNDAAEKTAKLQMGISDGKWNTAITSENPKNETTADVTDVGSVTIHAIDADGDQAQVEYEYPQTDIPTQVVVVDDKGTEHKSENINIRSNGQSCTVTCKFEIPVDQVKKVLFQSRPFTKFVDVAEVSLEKGTITHPDIKVRDAKDGK